MRNKVVVEAREYRGGPLKFNCEQPPSKWIEGVSEDALFNYYFACNPKVNSASPNTLYEFLESKNWYARVKTW